MPKIITCQLGKNGVTSNFIEKIQEYFKKNKQIRISVLKNARSEGKEGKEQVKKYADEILKKLDGNYKCRILGFVIILRK